MDDQPINLDQLAHNVFPILEHFEFRHLPPALQKIAEPIRDLAYAQALRGLDCRPGRRAELAAGLRKLLEAKDCLVRSAL